MIKWRWVKYITKYKLLLQKPAKFTPISTNLIVYKAKKKFKKKA
jgi:hypothetical protein